MTKADKIRRYLAKGMKAADIVKKLGCNSSEVYRLVKPKTKKSAPKVARQTVNDIQIGGNHYKKYGTFQPWDVIGGWGLGFLDGNVVKYVARFRNKGGIEDLQKAKHYLDKLIEVETMNHKNRT